MKVKELENYITSIFKQKNLVFAKLRETQVIESITEPNLKQISIL